MVRVGTVRAGQLMANVSGLAQMVLTKTTGEVININAQVGTLVAFVETKDLHAGDPKAVKFLEAVLVEITKPDKLHNMKVKIKHRERLDESLQDGDEFSLLNNHGPHPVRPPDDVYFRLRFEDLGVLDIWKLSAFELYGGIIAEDF